MSLTPVCGLPNVFAASNAVSLMQDFCACPAAVDMLKQVNVPLAIQMTPDLRHPAMMMPSLAKDHRLMHANIYISTKHNDDSAIFRLAFEVSNAIQESKEMPFRLAIANGDVGMDDYARQIELSEVNSTKNTFALQLKCSEFPGFEITELARVLNAFSEEEHLWHQDFECHTDVYRNQWITQNKAKYCQKHPEDVKSCKAISRDLCNLYTLNELPKQERYELSNKRLCERFSKAPPYFQSLFRYRVEENCPEILPSSGINFPVMLASISTMIAVVAARCFMR